MTSTEQPETPRVSTGFGERFWLHLFMFAAAPAWLVSAAWILSLRSSLADILSHCVFHVFIMTSVLTFVSGILWRRRRQSISGGQWIRRFILLAIPACFLFFCARPWELVPLVSNKQSQRPTKILFWNVYLLNPNYADIAAFIAKHDPDIVAIMECNLHLANQLANVRTHYVTQMWNPGWNSQSNIVLTKFPDAELARHSILGMEMTQVTFQPLQSDRQHQLYFLHTLSPGWPGNRVHIRNQQLETMAGEIGKNETDPIIVMGDFNTSPWSRIFRKVLAQARLIDTRAYRGYFSSWPSFFYDLGIPIDHALVNDKVNVIRREVLYDGIGSDHRPVLLEIE